MTALPIDDEVRLVSQMAAIIASTRQPFGDPDACVDFAYRILDRVLDRSKKQLTDRQQEEFHRRRAVGSNWTLT